MPSLWLGRPLLVAVQGAYFSRNWCQLELFCCIEHSPVYDIYTHKLHVESSGAPRHAVGISGGPRAADLTLEDQQQRQQHFPARCLFPSSVRPPQYIAALTCCCLSTLPLPTATSLHHLGTLLPHSTTRVHPALPPSVYPFSALPPSDCLVGSLLAKGVATVVPEAVVVDVQSDDDGKSDVKDWLQEQLDEIGRNLLLRVNRGAFAAASLANALHVPEQRDETLQAAAAAGLKELKLNLQVPLMSCRTDSFIHSQIRAVIGQ